MEKCGVFISYSHEDIKYVTPIVQMVKAIRKDLVFQDTVDIKPGQLWEPQLRGALSESELVIVFWCHHSSSSEYVKREYEAAIEHKKDVLPLLLDDCELNPTLAQYQWIDLRGAIFHREPNTREENHKVPTKANFELPGPPIASPKRFNPKANSILLLFMLAIILITFFYVEWGVWFRVFAGIWAIGFAFLILYKFLTRRHMEVTDIPGKPIGQTYDHEGKASKDAIPHIGSSTIGEAEIVYRDSQITSAILTKLSEKFPNESIGK